MQQKYNGDMCIGTTVTDRIRAKRWFHVRFARSYWWRYRNSGGGSFSSGTTSDRFSTDRFLTVLFLAMPRARNRLAEESANHLHRHLNDEYTRLFKLSVC